ncbi:MAG TPA: hypothetical protein VFI70_10400 [Nitrososphaeraceae archaeon]|nr:hypothetical protein [Nitrososphaeraceae archaeon]
MISKLIDIIIFPRQNSSMKKSTKYNPPANVDQVNYYTQKSLGIERNTRVDE